MYFSEICSGQYQVRHDFKTDENILFHIQQFLQLCAFNFYDFYFMYFHHHYDCFLFFSKEYSQLLTKCSFFT